MIDRDDREDQEAGGDAATIDNPDEGHETAGEAQDSADAQDAEADAADAAEPDEDQPVMQLEGGSDEGGTIEDHPGEDAPAATHEDDEAAPEADAAPSEEEDQAFEGQDLGLVSDDDALPWLESSDFEEVESVDAWRITGFVVMGLVVLALIVGGVWYVNQRGEEGALVADGSIIEAPEGPYKVPPEDPGGKTFEGTGDMAPAVGEGESREGRLAQKSATPEPVARATQTPAPTPTRTAQASPSPSPSAAQAGGVAVQVGAYRDEATAEAGWRQLQRQTDALGGVRYRIVKGQADIGTVYRLQAMPGDMATARRLRDALQADGVASQIKQ